MSDKTTQERELLLRLGDVLSDVLAILNRDSLCEDDLRAERLEIRYRVAELRSHAKRGDLRAM